MQMRVKMISVGLLGAAVLLPIDYARADQVGHASWYSLPSNKTANGELMNPNELTAAHRSLPFGTKVLVENLANGRSVVVRINDRGPFIGGRIIDLSKAAAASIRIIESGTAKVRVTTAGGSAIAALGETTAKAKNGIATAAAAKVDVSPSKSPRVKAATKQSPTAKSVAARASAGKTRVAKRLEAQADVKMASASKRTGERSRVVATSGGIRAAAYQASSLPGRSARALMASNAHPYAVLGTTPSFMKPARSRRYG